jgi:hypothetical protein
MVAHAFSESLEKKRVVRDGGSILLHPGTGAGNDDDAHHFLVDKGFEFDTFETPGDGLKRKYWKIN